MNRNLLFALLLITAAFSCGRADRHVITVPKDAAFVFHINGAALSSKISWDEIKSSNWFRKLHAEADDSVSQNLLQSADSSGIDSQSDLVFFSKRHGSGGYTVFEGALTNAGAFEAFNKKMSKNATGAKDGELNILKNNSGIVTWTNTRFLYINNARGGGFPGNARSMPGEMHGEDYSFPYDSLVKFAKELYALDNDNNLLSDKRFEALIKESGDMHLWANAEYGMKGMGEGVLDFFNPGILFEGNITAGIINFENGRISMKSKTYYNKEMAKVYEKYRAKDFDMSVLNRIPSQNVVGLFAMNYPPEGIPPFLKTIGLDGMVNGFAGKLGFTMDEFVKANKGDLLLAVSDLDPKKPSTSDEPEEGPDQPFAHLNFNFLFATSVNDRAAFEKLLGIAKNGPDISALGFPKISYAMNDNWFAASNSEEHMKAFLAGGNNDLPFINKLRGHPMVFYLDLQKIVNLMPADSANTPGGSAGDASRNIWENIIVTGGEISDGAFNVNCEANMLDKSTNSLKQLNQFFDRIASGRRSAL